MNITQKIIRWFQESILGRRYFVGVYWKDGLQCSAHGYINLRGILVMTKVDQKKLVKVWKIK